MQCRIDHSRAAWAHTPLGCHPLLVTPTHRRPAPHPALPLAAPFRQGRHSTRTHSPLPLSHPRRAVPPQREARAPPLDAQVERLEPRARGAR
eukprot:5752085-Prymnesium_polylepis.1